MELFQSILKVQSSLPKDQPYKDLLQLINFVLRKFFKNVQDHPMLIVEVRRSFLSTLPFHFTLLSSSTLPPHPKQIFLPLMFRRTGILSKEPRPMESLLQLRTRSQIQIIPSRGQRGPRSQERVQNNRTDWDCGCVHG